MNKYRVLVKNEALERVRTKTLTEQKRLLLVLDGESMSTFGSTWDSLTVRLCFDI